MAESIAASEAGGGPPCVLQIPGLLFRVKHAENDYPGTEKIL